MISIVVENNTIDNYFTEKTLNCFAVGTIPVYLGCKNIGDFFDRNVIIQIGRWANIKKLVGKLTSRDYYNRMDTVREKHKLCKQYEIIEITFTRDIWRDSWL